MATITPQPLLSRDVVFEGDLEEALKKFGVNVSKGCDGDMYTLQCPLDPPSYQITVLKDLQIKNGASVMIVSYSLGRNMEIFWDFCKKTGMKSAN
jgi:hypothetical protein